MCAVSLLKSRLYLIIIMCMWRSTPFLSVDVCVESGGGLSTGAVVGIVNGAFVLLLFVGAVTGLLVWCLCCRDTPKKGTKYTCTCTQYSIGLCIVLLLVQWKMNHLWYQYLNVVQSRIRLPSQVPS